MRSWRASSARPCRAARCCSAGAPTRIHGCSPKQGENPFTAALDRARKYVASTTLSEPLAWDNSTLLSGDVAAAVAALRAQPGADIVILGSGELVRSLARHDLIDEYLLMTYPLILGAGRRMFADDGHRVALRLVDATTTSKGVVVGATNRAADRRLEWPLSGRGAAW